MAKFNIVVRRKEPEGTPHTTTHTFYNVEAENKEKAKEKIRAQYAFPEDEVE